MPSPPPPQPEQPTLILLHGSWHTPDIWKPLISCLNPSSTSNLYSIHTPLNPSVHSPPATHHDDATALQNLLSTLIITENRNVVLVMHSYAGQIGTEACQGLTARRRAAAGQPGGIIALIYLCAFMLRAGQSVLDIQPDLLDTLHIVDGMASPPAREFCYSDLPEEEVAEWWELLRPMSVCAWESRLTYEGWRDTECTYLVCDEDQAIPVKLQEGFVSRVREDGVDVRLVRCPAGHSPMLSWAKGVANVVREAAGRSSGAWKVREGKD